jgi:hypothetical protein
MIQWESGASREGLHLFTVEEFNKLPDGLELESINGDKKVKGVDNIDMDTRFGYIAWGVKDPWNHPEKHLFLTFKIAQ